eukprot:6492171-Lingulodinium_polyedra.AAC.1
MLWNVSSVIGGGSPSANGATRPGGVEVSWLTVAVGGGVIRSFFDGRVGGVEHGAAAFSRNRLSCLRWRSFARGPPPGGA